MEHAKGIAIFEASNSGFLFVAACTATRRRPSEKPGTMPWKESQQESDEVRADRHGLGEPAHTSRPTYPPKSLNPLNCADPPMTPKAPTTTIGGIGDLGGNVEPNRTIGGLGAIGGNVAAAKTSPF
jgi:hypothetical protein